MSSRKQTLDAASARLAATNVPDAQLDAQWLLSHVLGISRLLLLADLHAPLSPEDESRYDALLSRRAAGEPLQYVLGEASFMGHTFRVDSRVLIPRSDTETLCVAALARLNPGMRALDIGTGSGALAISMALACNGAHITAVDISADALVVAQANATELGASVTWLESNLFAALSGQRFHMIVSNPPYIPTGDLATLQAEVRREPQTALDGGSDGLSFYRRILAKLPDHLEPGGFLALEVGDGQSQPVASLLQGHFDAIQILRDLQGLDRTVIGDRYAG